MLLTKLKVTAAVLLVLGIASIGIGSLTYPATAQQAQAVKSPSENTKAQLPKGEVSTPTPPDLKEGVRVIFGPQSIVQTLWRFTDDGKSPVVVRVKGSWVLLKGIEPQGYTSGLGECWVNFDTVGWYMVVPK
jgi:hypothetical protein